MYNTIGNGGTEGNIGGFDSYIIPTSGVETIWYWSSTNSYSTLAKCISFAMGNTNSKSKSNSHRVRVIRSF